MAEAAATSLAAGIISKLGCHEAIFFTDNEVLASFLNTKTQEYPPDWRIKPFTEVFKNYLKSIQHRVLKLDRSQNVMAHFLARCAFRSHMHPSKESTVLCSNENHSLYCPLKEALQHVSFPLYCTLSASCC
jgi:hypothetical protein